jgi:hypothetical protein
MYNILESTVLLSLRKEIAKSKTESKHIDSNVIKVNVFGYTELGIIHDRLCFMDSNGLQYGVYADCTLEDLIDILTGL